MGGREGEEGREEMKNEGLGRKEDKWLVVGEGKDVGGREGGRKGGDGE